jgi:hypothetical protein
MTPEQELRQFFSDRLDKLENKVDGIKDEMVTLKVKVALFSSLIGSLAAFVANKFF